LLGIRSSVNANIIHRLLRCRQYLGGHFVTRSKSLPNYRSAQEQFENVLS
jgi:hypothetical protein